ncbi:hypothetical protein CS063_13215 [Sporanaerobium hydrogeniformans]|uniref:Uncharacterized protein n=1 Tax=Sporanaerobium hydrogeniformans TaxID=3072179 RepID=A0AC61DBN0_9FIRM|nr:hypothetical protein [Sporanaerobium hydrogeniformans]PHV69937.1 hypothetical protein CS063_13215 [Sporanaerobium hydrogeniformans]
MPPFAAVSGIITSIESFPTSTNDKTACSLIIGIKSNNQNLTYFTLDLNTYFVNHVTLQKGDSITAYYDTSVPVVLIYPPRYRAVVIAKNSRDYFVKVDYFNNELVSSDNQLKLNISPRTQRLLPNNQNYLGELRNRNLVVLYRRATKSIPAVTTPFTVIVLCL